MKLPKVKHLRQLLYWMEERQRIYLARQAGQPPPWTQDPVLRQFKFCNVYREQDRVTAWIRENWREPYARNGNLWFAMSIARLLNWPDTLQAVGYPRSWDPQELLHVLRQRKHTGQKVYTSAYLLGMCPAGQDRAVYFAHTVLNSLYLAAHNGAYRDGTRPPFLRRDCTLQAAFNWLLQFRGWGRFLAYEVITDLRHTRYLNQAPDINSWANVGPGALRGLNRLYERELNTSRGGQQQYLAELLAIRDWLLEKRDTKLLPTLEPRDVEHSCCEVDKYQRASAQIKAHKPVTLERYRSSLVQLK